MRKKEKKRKRESKNEAEERAEEEKIIRIFLRILGPPFAYNCVMSFVQVNGTQERKRARARVKRAPSYASCT